MTSRVYHITKNASLLKILYKMDVFSQISKIRRPALIEQCEVTQHTYQNAWNSLQSKLALKIHVVKGFYTLEMSPPKFNEVKEMQEDLALVKEFIKKGCFKYITVKQAWLLLLVCTEICLWFFLGETIGKFHIVGYKV